MTTLTETPYKNFFEFDELEGSDEIENSNLEETFYEEDKLSRSNSSEKPLELSESLHNLEEQQKLRNHWRQKKEQKEKREMQKFYSAKEALERNRTKSCDFKEAKKKSEKKPNSTRDNRMAKNNQKRRIAKEEKIKERSFPKEGTSPPFRSHSVGSGGSEETRNKPALMFSLWQQEKKSDSSTRSLNGKNSIPSWSPSLIDLHSAVFLPNNSFSVGEIVLVPRTRGGFSYGQIKKQTFRSHCFFDPQIPHKSLVWRVVYPSNGKHLFKDLPPSYVGKLKNGVNRDQVLHEDNTLESDCIVGKKASLKDLQNVVFSSQCHFKVGEIVLVPRSRGGFTYGRISRDTKQNCFNTSIDKTHPLNAWRVIVSEENPTNVTRKDLAAGLIGKIHLLGNGQVPDTVPTINETESVSPRKETSDIEEKEKKSLSVEDEEPEEDIVLWKGRDHDNSPVEKSPETPKDPSPEVSQSEGKELSTSDPGPSIRVEDTEIPISQIGGLLPVNKDQLLKNLMKKKLTAPKKEVPKHLIVIDGPNVAKRHGKETEFSAKGIKIAIDYWIERGHDAIAFIPEHYVKRKPGQSVTLQEFYPKANNVPLLLELINEGKLVLTPPQDYDDSYCIEYAMRHNGVIVTNDRYWDHVDKQREEKGERARKEARKWIRDHTMSFTFVRDEFLPNPNFKFPPLKSKS